MAFLVQLNLGNPQTVNEFCDAVKPDHRDLCFQSAGENLRSWVASDKGFAEKYRKLSSARGRGDCLDQNEIHNILNSIDQ
jgi:hypothetical protein